MTIQVTLGMLGGLAVGALAWRAGWLVDRTAALAAAVVGGAIFSFAGWPGALLLLAFFVSSSLVSKLPRPGSGAASMTESSIQHRSALRTAAPPRQSGAGVEPKRTARQVFANGSVAAAAAVILGFVSGMGISDPIWARMALAGALAAATADTWATEIGTWWGGTPRSALSGRIVEPGESGGVTPAGTLAAMMGAAWIGLVAYWVWPDIGVPEAFMLEAAGFAGMWADSALGALVQYKADCPTCARIVEDPQHEHPVERRRGLVWLDNHAVNVVCTLVGALSACYMALTL